MHSLFAYSPVSEETVRALCWALVHSLWQGLLLALLAAAVLFFTQKKPASTRYTLLAALFALYLGGVGFTLWYQLNLEQTTETGFSVAVGGITVPEITAGAPNTGPGGSIPEALAVFFNTRAPWIVSFWGLIFCLKCLKMGIQLGMIRRLRRAATLPAVPAWQRKVQDLASRLGVRQAVTLLESARVQVPSAIGIFKPVILFPLGMLAQLPTEQVEAILLHELAHIRRRDFLVNLLQHFAEAVLFFNPAVLWVSNLIRQEREHCCDDIALTVLNNKAGYLRALTYFEQLQVQGPPHVAAFPGRTGQLLHRVKRIIGQHNTKTLSNMEKVTLITSVLIAGFIACLPGPAAQAQTEPTSINLVQLTVNDVNVIQAKIVGANGKTYSLKQNGKKVLALTVDGQPVPENKLADYEWLFKAVGEQIERDQEQALRDQEQAERDQEQAQRDQEQAENDQQQAQRDQEQAKLDQEQAENERQEAQGGQEQVENDRQEAQLEREKAKRDKEQAHMDKEQAKRDKEQAHLDKEQAKRDKEQAHLDKEQAKRDKEQAQLDKEQAERDRIQARKDREMVENMLGDMIGDKIVEDRNSLKTFELSDTEFKVNGKKQPDELFKKYKAKYLDKPNSNIRYTNERGGAKTGIYFQNDGN